MKIYANLIGNWVCLNDDKDCIIGESRLSPDQWWEEHASIWNPKTIEEEHTMYQLPYVNLVYKGVSYRISPYHIQVVNF